LTPLRSIRPAASLGLSVLATLALGACSDSPTAPSAATEGSPVVQGRGNPLPTHDSGNLPPADPGDPPHIELPELGDDAAAVNGTRRMAVAIPGQVTPAGFVCSSYPRFLRNNFPNMKSISGAPENVYFQNVLYRFNGSSPTIVGTTGWFTGRSNGVGYMFMGVSNGAYYYFALPAGPVFGQGPEWNHVTPLTPGVYRVAEYYFWQNGGSLSRWARDRVSGVDYCQIY
jgi:hypothetical protein